MNVRMALAQLYAPSWIPPGTFYYDPTEHAIHLNPSDTALFAMFDAGFYDADLNYRWSMRIFPGWPGVTKIELGARAAHIWTDPYTLCSTGPKSPSTSPVRL